MSPKCSYILILSTILTACGIAKNPPYIVEDFNQLTAGHQIVAILPYEPIHVWQKRKRGDLDLWGEQVNISGPYLQKKIYTACAKRVNSGKLDLAFQSFLITNEILEQNNINYPNLKTTDKVFLGRLLGVDSVFLLEHFDHSGVHIRRPGSTEATELGDNILFSASLFDTATGKLLWKNDLFMPIQTRADTPERLATKAINSFAKFIPYNLGIKVEGPEIKEFVLP